MSSIKSTHQSVSILENHVHAWRDSGFSRAQYCRENKLRYHQFIYWIPKAGPKIEPRIVTAPISKLLPVVIKQ